MYKLIAIDMDGTFLNSKHEISKENIEAVKKAQELGTRVVILSGRQHKDINDIIQRHGLDCDMIGLNGAEVLEKDGKVVSIRYMEEESVLEVIRLCDEEQVLYQIFNSDIIISNDFKDPFSEFVEIAKLKYSEAEFTLEKAKEFYNALYDYSAIEKDMISYIKQNSIKVIKMLILSHDNNKLERIKSELLKRNDINITSSFRGNLEVFHNNVDKGIALMQLADDLNIKREEIIAIGDNLNDLSMITEAGLGVAMGNALDEVKQKANYITKTNDEHGVAHVIEKFILK